MEKNDMKYVKLNFIGILWMITFFVSGCGRVGEKSASMVVMYQITGLLAAILLVLYCLTVQKKDIWFLALFSSITIVNIGYYALAISKTLEEALLANRIAYLGSVFLPVSMLMIIMNVCQISYKKWVVVLLGFISIFIFFIAASPGYSDIYYKEVTLGRISGVTVLNKIYGAWHDLYLIYLFGYFGIMIALILYAKLQKKAESQIYATILGGAVFVNIGVWLLEQLIKIDFEILSVSYIITEFFLLSLCLMMQEKLRQTETKDLVVAEENEETADIKEKANQSESISKEVETSEEWLERRNYFAEHLYLLTKTEKCVYDFYLEDKTTKEIMKAMDITENTLKYHNKNIYSKLGVSSHKQLKEIARHL